MNCSNWEREIASEVESSELEVHLMACESCREFADELEMNRTALGSLTVDAAALDAVRRNVLGEIRRDRRRSWIWPLVAAACVAIVSAALVLTRLENPELPRPVEFAKAPQLVEWTVQPRPVQHRHAATVAQREPLVVKMLTNDPDVIIVWLIDQKGE
jgi:hypothetical protein